MKEIFASLINQLRCLMKPDNTNAATSQSFALIDMDVLLWEDSPILFTGKNELGQQVIGSSVDEDNENRQEYFVYVLPTEQDAKDFLAGNITLLELWKRHPLCLVEKSFDATHYSYTSVQIKDIPEPYWPTDQSFVPDYSRIPCEE
jgi:hypothetical protein